MATIDVMQTLRDAEKATARELNAIRAAIKAMAETIASSVGGRRGPARPRAAVETARGPRRRRRGMSAAPRKAVSDRMRKYWAMRRKEKGKRAAK